MVASPDRNYMSPQEYLEWEEGQEIKYEYIDGEEFLRNEPQRRRGHRGKRGGGD